MAMEAAVKRASALAKELNRTEIYGLVKGVGYPDWTWNPPHGFFVGNTDPVPSKGIPSLNLQDNGQGYRTFEPRQVPQVTAWPSTLGVAATWDRHLGRAWGEALGREFFLKGANVLLGPGLNVHRVARNGRNIEYLSGESGYLGAQLVPGYVEGVHSQHVLTVMKHFIANHQETIRSDVDAQVDNRILFETYYPPFQGAIDAGCLATMCAYNLVNGKHACGNPETLEGHLKTNMQYKGWVMSDWWATHNFSAMDGLDQEMPGNCISLKPDWQVFFTPENLDTLSDEKVQDMATRILTGMVRYGLLEHPVCQPEGGGCLEEQFDVVATSPKHQQLARRMVADSVILLKNDGDVLPFTRDIKKIALLGSACDPPNDVEALLKQWDMPNYYTFGGSGRIVPNNPLSILKAVEAYCIVSGCEVVSELNDTVQDALNIAADADLAVICSATTSSEGYDRSSLSVDQEDYVVNVSTQLSGVRKLSISIIPGAIVLPWIEHVDAAVAMFLAGEATGTGLLDVLDGRVTPGGKLPVTFPLKEEDAIQPCEDPMCEYTEGLFAGFPWYEDKEVAFPFGHGLSYTKFDHELTSLGSFCETEVGPPSRPSGPQHPGLRPPGSRPGGKPGATPSRPGRPRPPGPPDQESLACAQVKILNSGARKGTEVVQMYLGFPDGLGEPQKLLRGFQKVHLNAGSSTVVNLELRAPDISVWSEEDQWHIPEGTFKIYIGSSSRDIRAEAEFSVSDGQLEFVS